MRGNEIDMTEANSINKNKLKITIMLLALIQMGSVFMSPIIGDLIKAFPDYSVSTVQMLMTWPNLVVVIVSLFMGKMEAGLTKKQLTSGAAISAIIGAVGLCLFHTSLPVLYFFATFIGLASGTLLSILATIISVYFEPDKQGAMMGLTNSVTNIGGMSMNIIAGLLASIAWYFGFLAPLIVIPGLVCAISFMPSDRGAKKEGTKAKAPKRAYLYIVISGMFGLMFNMLPTNMSLIIEEKGLGGASVSGLVTALFLGGGVLGGVIYPVLQQKLNDKSISVAFLNLGLGFIILSMANNLVVLFIGAFIGGCSITILMSQLTLSASGICDASAVAGTIALIIALNNFGGFIAPTVFSIVPGSDLALKFRIVGTVAIIVCVVLFVLFARLGSMANRGRS